jgi:hypothetical protein
MFLSDYDERNAWLATVKEGDTVCMRNRGWGSTYYELFTVKRTTATQIVCTRGLFNGRLVEVKFRKDGGSQVGSDNYAYIEPVTDKVKATNRRYYLEQWFSNLKATGLTTECLEEMCKAYNSFDNPYKDKND